MDISEEPYLAYHQNCMCFLAGVGSVGCEKIEIDLGSDSGFPVFSLKPGLSHCISLSLSFPSCQMGTMTSISVGSL